MSWHYRKTVYQCRAPLCKRKNQVWQRVDELDRVVETAPAWEERCALCGRGSLDLIYQKVFKPEEERISLAAMG